MAARTVDEELLIAIVAAASEGAWSISRVLAPSIEHELERPTKRDAEKMPAVSNVHR